MTGNSSSVRRIGQIIGVVAVAAMLAIAGVPTGVFGDGGALETVDRVVADQTIVDDFEGGIDSGWTFDDGCSGDAFHHVTNITREGDGAMQGYGGEGGCTQHVYAKHDISIDNSVSVWIYANATSQLGNPSFTFNDFHGGVRSDGSGGIENIGGGTSICSSCLTGDTWYKWKLYPDPSEDDFDFELIDTDGNVVASKDNIPAYGGSYSSVQDTEIRVSSQYPVYFDFVATDGQPIPSSSSSSTQTWTFELQDSGGGMFPKDDTELRAFTGGQEQIDTFDYEYSGTWNWENRTKLDLDEGKTYSIELVNTETGDRYVWSENFTADGDFSTDDGSVYEVDPPNPNPPGEEGGPGTGGGWCTLSTLMTNCDISSWPTPTQTDDGNTSDGTPTDDGGSEPCSAEPCAKIGDDDQNVTIEYWDPDYQTVELKYALTDDNETWYNRTREFDPAIGYFYTQVNESNLPWKNASNTTVYLYATEKNGTTHNGTSPPSSRDSGGAVFGPIGPSGNAPDSPLGQGLLFLLVLLGIAGSYAAGRRYAPASEYPNLPVSPLFIGGSVTSIVLGLEFAGGGLVSFAIAQVVSRTGPVIALGGAALAGYIAYRRYGENDKIVDIGGGR